MTRQVRHGRQSTRDAIRLLGAEIALLSERLLRLENGIDLLGQARGAVAPETIRHLQEMDILVQSSRLLASYAQALSERIDPEEDLDMQDVLAALPLRDVALRLAGAQQVPGKTDFEML